MTLPEGFWTGLLILPIVVSFVAGAAALAFGGWLLLEFWRRERFLRLHPTSPDHAEGMPSGRVQHAALFALAPRAWRFKVGFGCCLLFYRGVNRVPVESLRVVRGALQDASKELQR